MYGSVVTMANLSNSTKSHKPSERTGIMRSIALVALDGDASLCAMFGKVDVNRYRVKKNSRKF